MSEPSPLEASGPNSTGSNFDKWAGKVIMNALTGVETAPRSATALFQGFDVSQYEMMGANSSGLTREKLEKARRIMMTSTPKGHSADVFYNEYMGYEKPSVEYIRIAVPRFRSQENHARRSYEFQATIGDETVAYEIEKRLMDEMRRDAERRFRSDPALRGYRPNELLHERETQVNQEVLILILRYLVRKNEPKEDMTRADYTLIAKGIAESGLRALDKQIVAEDLCKVLKTTNPKFDAQKFINACTQSNDHRNNPPGITPADIRIDETPRE